MLQPKQNVVYYQIEIANEGKFCSNIYDKWITICGQNLFKNLIVTNFN